MLRYLHYTFLPLILALTFLLGSRMIFAGDFFYLADQARDMLLVQDIVENKNLTLIGTHSGLGGFFHGPLWLYLLIPFYVVGGGNPLAFTYVYVMIALITVLVGYFVGAKLYGTKSGLLFAGLLATSAAIWAFVPNTIGVNMVPLVFLPMFYFLIKFIRGDEWAFIFAIFFAGLSLQFETALPLILIPVVILSLFLNRKVFKNAKVLLLSVVSLAVSLATFILFDLKHNFLMTRSLLTLFTSGKREQGYLEFPERLMIHGQSLKSVYESVLVNQTVLLELLLAVMLLSFVFLAFKSKLYKKNEWKEFLYLILFPVFIFVFYLFYGYPVFSEYLLGLTIPAALAMTIALKHLWRHQVAKILVVLFIGLTVIDAGRILYLNYLTPYKHDTSSGSYIQQKKVTEWIMQDSRGEKFGYFVYTPSTFTYGMDYLLWWESKSRNLEKPESKKYPTTYLILYPPLENDQGAHAFWKKTKVRTQAKVVDRKKFESGIIVEKLSMLQGEPEADPTLNQNLIFR